MTKGKIFVLSGPSGIGKDMIINAILERHREITAAQSYTTMPPRPHHDTKRQYRYVSKEVFMRLIREEKIVEWVKHHNFLFGTAVDSLNPALEQGKTVITIAEPKGALKIKEKYPGVVLMFVKPESLESLRPRLEMRTDLTREEIEIRMKDSEKEIKFIENYDYVVVNPEGQPEKAIEEVEKIIKNS